MCAATNAPSAPIPQKSHKIQHLAIRNTKLALQIGFSILISFHFSTIFFPVSNIIKILFKCNIKKTLNGWEVVLFLLGFGFLIFAMSSQEPWGADSGQKGPVNPLNWRRKWVADQFFTPLWQLLFFLPVWKFILNWDSSFQNVGWGRQNQTRMLPEKSGLLTIANHH